MEHKVKFVEGDHPAIMCMPEGRMWLICITERRCTLYLRMDAQHLTTEQKERQLEEAWGGYRALTEREVRTGEFV